MKVRAAHGNASGESVARGQNGDTVFCVGQVAVVGDIGGHLCALQETLTQLGCEGPHIPEGLVVCQVGDLIHRGPASGAVVTYVDEIMKKNPGQWVQLLGNHEENEILRHQFEWPDRVDDATRDTLMRWWEDGSMQLAWSFDMNGVRDPQTGELTHSLADNPSTNCGEVLVTHAGVTVGVWEQLGRTQSAHDAAQLINAERYNYQHAVWNTGVMLERQIRRDAGVVWARADDELLWFWNNQLGPGFHQVHGHSSAYNWGRGRYQRRDLEGILRGQTSVDTRFRHLRTELEGGTIWGCDPQHGAFPVTGFAPLVFETL